MPMTWKRSDFHTCTRYCTLVASVRWIKVGTFDLDLWPYGLKLTKTRVICAPLRHSSITKCFFWVIAHYIVRCCVARRRAYVQSASVLRLSETETCRLRTKQRGDQVQLSTTVPPTVLRLHRQPGAVLRLPRSLRQRLLQNESDGRRSETRLLRSWGIGCCVVLLFSRPRMCTITVLTYHSRDVA